jgi:RNA polymerase sigma-70 factor (ECF subfamily)
MPVSADDPLPPDDYRSSGAMMVDFETLYRLEGPRLSRFFARRAPADDVLDLVQETFRRLLARLGEPREAIGCPEAWLSRTAGNLLLDRSRRRRVRGEPETFDEKVVGGRDPYPALEARDEIERIDAALLELPTLARDIFLLHRLGGHSYAEIAAARGLKVKAVEKQIAKALLLLRGRLRPGE